MAERGGGGQERAALIAVITEFFDAQADSEDKDQKLAWLSWVDEFRHEMSPRGDRLYDAIMALQRVAGWTWEAEGDRMEAREAALIEADDAE